MHCSLRASTFSCRHTPIHVLTRVHHMLRVIGRCKVPVQQEVSVVRYHPPPQRARSATMDHRRVRRGAGREVRDAELFSPPAVRASHALTRAPPARPKRPRTADPPRVLPDSSPRTKPRRPRALPAVVAAAAAVAAVQPAPAAKRRKCDTGLEAERAGAAESPRTVAASCDIFGALPWRAGRGREEGLVLLGVPRLSERVLGLARALVARGMLSDISRLPDDFAHAVLGGATQVADLVRLEALNPGRVEVFEACWARVVQSKYKISVLPEGVKWWRGFYEMREEEEAARLEKAKELLQRRYSAQEEARRTRNVSATQIVRGEPDRRRRRASAGPAQAPTLLSRLRAQARQAKLGTGRRR